MSIHELSRQDLIFVLESVEDSLKCKNIVQFETLTEKIKSHLNFEYAFCTSVNKKDNELSSVFELSYPKEYLSRYFDNKYYLDDHVLTELISTFQVQHWKTMDCKYQSLEMREPFVIEAYEFGLEDGLTFGTIDADQEIATCFSFSGKAIENLSRSASIIEYITPHLAEILKRVFYQKKNLTENLLSQREREVISWVKEGKSSWEIGVILGVQERTINFHISNIKRKLNASTRTQAVAIAVAKGEISI